MIGITRVPFGDLVETVSYRGHQVDASRFLPSGQYPVVDQGENEIAGYVNDVEPIKAPLPLVVFGDHTRNVKFADRPFVVGADGVKLLRPKDQRIGARYLYWLTIFAGSRIPNLGYSRHFSSLREVVVPVLESAEARAKAAFYLDRVQHIVDTLSAVIAAKREFKRGLMQELLTGRRRFPEFASEPWIEAPLGELFSERSETGFEHLPLLAVTGDRGVVLRDELDRRDTSSKDKSKYKRVCPGDIAYNTMRMWQGVSGLSQYEGIVSPAYTVVTPTGPMMGRYARHLFKLPRIVHSFWRHSQGLVDDTLSLKFPRFAIIQVTFPSRLDEQQRIASVLDAIDREIEVLIHIRTAYDNQKRGLMQKLLTGELTVPVSSEPEPVHA